MQHCCFAPRPEHTHAVVISSACDVMANARDTKQSPICHAEIQSIFLRRVLAYLWLILPAQSSRGVVTIAALSRASALMG
jgi:hypothetical protein